MFTNMEKLDEKTKAIQVPISEIDTILKCIQYNFYRLPLYLSRISAGNPTHSENNMEKRMDLNDYLIKHPDTTFLLRVSGSSMINAGIYHNDILIVDRSLEPTDGNIVVASINGELTVKRLKRDGDRLYLMPENNKFKPIEINEYTDFRIWGVATNSIHSLK
jgi:DNA polymerase V